MDEAHRRSGTVVGNDGAIAHFLVPVHVAFALAGELAVEIGLDAFLGQVHEVSAVAVERACAGDGKIFGLVGPNEAVTRAESLQEVRVDAARVGGFDFVIRQIIATFDDCAGFQIKIHSAAQHDGAGDELAGRNVYCAAARFHAGVDGLAECQGVHGLAVAFGAIVGDVEDRRSLSECAANQQQERIAGTVWRVFMMGRTRWA